MYDRSYDDQVLTFEASGGLINSSLVLQDQETDTYWAIMTGEAVHGEKYGTRLKELAINRKMKWKRWKNQHPDTSVLSLDGVEDIPDRYGPYFASPVGFRGAAASDPRLNTKDPIFAFRLGARKYAVHHDDLVMGTVFRLGDQQVLLLREQGAEMFQSTLAFATQDGDFRQETGAWLHTASGCRLNPESEEFQGVKTCPARLPGFDTFWYNWSLSNPETELLKNADL